MKIFLLLFVLFEITYAEINHSSIDYQGYIDTLKGNSYPFKGCKYYNNSDYDFEELIILFDNNSIFYHKGSEDIHSCDNNDDYCQINWHPLKLSDLNINDLDFNYNFNLDTNSSTVIFSNANTNNPIANSLNGKTIQCYPFINPNTMFQTDLYKNFINLGTYSSPPEPTVYVNRAPLYFFAIPLFAPSSLADINIENPLSIERFVSVPGVTYPYASFAP